MKQCPGVLGAMCAVLVASMAGEEQDRRFDPTGVPAVLKNYYDGEVTYPDWGKSPWGIAINHLGSKDADEAGTASRFVRAILSQAQEDERSGRAQWYATPFWGSTGENKARKLRELMLWNIKKLDPQVQEKLTKLETHFPQQRRKRLGLNRCRSRSLSWSASLRSATSFP